MSHLCKNMGIILFLHIWRHQESDLYNDSTRECRNSSRLRMRDFDSTCDAMTHSRETRKCSAFVFVRQESSRFPLELCRSRGPKWRLLFLSR